MAINRDEYLISHLSSLVLMSLNGTLSDGHVFFQFIYVTNHFARISQLRLQKNFIKNVSINFKTIK